MKSLLDFVACGRCSNHRTSDPPESEESQWLVPIRHPVRHRWRRSSAADWRPSLAAIKEDYISPERKRRSITFGCETILRRKYSSRRKGTRTGTAHPARSLDDIDAYRKFERPIVFTDYAPTFWL